jgi:hypothetical protein
VTSITIFLQEFMIFCLFVLFFLDVVSPIFRSERKNSVVRNDEF